MLKKSLLIIGILVFSTVLFAAAVSDYLWFVDMNNKTLLKMNKDTGKIVTSTQLSDFSWYIAIDEDYIWVSTIKEVVKVSKVTGEIVNTYPFIDVVVLNGITVDDRYVWVACSKENFVRRIEKATGEIVTYSNAGENPVSLVTDNEFVFVGNGELTKFTRITKATSEIRSKTVNDHQKAVAVNNDSVWIALASSNQLIQYNKNLDIELDTINIDYASVVSFVVDDEYLWIPDNNGDVVNQIDINNDSLTKKASVVKVIKVGDGPINTALDDNHLWVVNANDSSISKVDKHTSEVVNTFSTGDNSFPMSMGDITGYYYDTTFGKNLFLSYKKIKGKSKNSNIASNVADDDKTTYFEPSKDKTKLRLNFHAKQTVDKAAFDIKLLSADPVSLKWKLQYKKKGKWKVFKVLKDGVKTKLKGEIIINNDQAIVIGTDLAIKAKKFRLILKNQEMNGTIGSYAITEFEGLQ